MGTAVLALVLVLAAGAVGAYMVWGPRKESATLTMISSLHFVLAGGGAGAVATFAFADMADPMFRYALILYGAAAVGGFFMLFMRFGEKRVPKPLLFGHIGAAGGGTLLLLVGLVA